MIERISGWSWEPRRQGILLAPPDRESGTLLYAERVRPIRTIRAILRTLDPSSHPLRLVGVEPTATDEGEHAVIATLADDAHHTRTVGVVYGDDFYSLCVGTPAAPDHAALFEAKVRECVARDAHGLGVRRRRFVYDPPAGWQGLLEGPFHAAWYPPDFPSNRSRLSVYPAMPSTNTVPTSALLAMMLESADLRERRVCDVTTPSGLSGTWEAVTLQHPDGSALRHDFITFDDRRYFYALVFEAPGPRYTEQLPVLEGVIRSIQPIPHARGERRATETGFSWFAD